MRAEVTLAPPYSIVFVLAHSGAGVPTISGTISSSSSCIAIGTLAEMDGTTRIVLSDEDQEPAGLLDLGIYRLQNIGGAIVVQSANGEDLLRYEVSTEECSVHVYVNRLDEPDEIVLCIEAA